MHNNNKCNLNELHKFRIMSQLGWKLEFKFQKHIHTNNQVSVALSMRFQRFVSKYEYLVI